MGMTRKYWKGIDELKETPQFLESRDQEFPAEIPVEEFLADENLGESSTGRRDFLKFLGFSVAAAAVAACEAPVTRAVPYVNKPENVIPGMATWYASTYYDGNSYASILVKTREGRPIFIKGNKDFGITGGSANPQIIASVLSLYDSERLQGPTINGEDKSYKDVDGGIIKGLKAAKRVALVSNTVISPSLGLAIQALGESLPGELEHIQYDAVSYAGMRAANKASFGSDMIPDYDFSKAKTIVSVGADFLSTWLFPTQFAPQYGKTRNPDAEWMSKHFQFESVMSITGSNADARGMIKPSEEANVLAYLIKGMGGNAGSASTKIQNSTTQEIAKEALKSLKASKGESIVVAGSNDTSVQILANKLNSILGNYGSTINTNDPIELFKSNDEAMMNLVNDVIKGKGPDAIIFMGVNPAYSLPNGEEFATALSKVKTTVAIASHADETASNCTYVCPSHHALEDWTDYNPKMSHYALGQPTIRPLYNTSSPLESILVWSDLAKRGGKDSKVAYDYIRNNWMTIGFQFNPAGFEDPEDYWNMAVHNSCMSMDMSSVPAAEGETDMEAPAATSTSFNDGALSGLKFPKGGDTEIVLYQKASMGTGNQANNPWLQEMPDPMTKVTWDNYITMNPTEMDKKGYATRFDQESGLNMATVTVGNDSITLPVYPMPGQALGTVGIALGYGRGSNGERIGRSAYRTKQYGGYVRDENGKPEPIGANAFAFVGTSGKTYSYAASGSLKDAEGTYLIGATQIQSTVMGRHSIVRETTKSIYDSKEKEAYNPAHVLGKLDKNGEHVSAPISEFNLWDEHPVENIGHRWGMTIDLSSCIGCGSCLIACQSENNVPVVGKDEVRRGREMHWLRIDRYFASDVEAAPGQRKDHDLSKMEFFAAAEEAAENPKVVHMPMMCHHCNHAPCETVCPVAATTHSNEGLNQMAYNRCIGTRYCANNCPYKVRRFNWFNYPSYKAQTEINPAQDDIGRMVLNPDVTVRTRGVMEKCSFCVQRIQAGKLNAKEEGRPVQDGDYSTACSDVCPTNAIIVGDWNDPESKIRLSADDKRSYQALEEVGVKPNVWFKVKVRNEENDLLDALQVVSAHHGGGHEAEGEHTEAHGEGNHH